jgi:hypothetical protein
MSARLALIVFTVAAWAGVVTTLAIVHVTV